MGRSFRPSRGEPSPQKTVFAFHPTGRLPNRLCSLRLARFRKNPLVVILSEAKDPFGFQNKRLYEVSLIAVELYLWLAGDWAVPLSFSMICVKGKAASGGTGGSGHGRCLGGRLQLNLPGPVMAADETQEENHGAYRDANCFRHQHPYRFLIASTTRSFCNAGPFASMER